MRKLFVSNERTKQPVLFGCVLCTIIILGNNKCEQKEKHTERDREICDCRMNGLIWRPLFSYSFDSVIKKFCFLAQKVMIRPLILVGDIKYYDVCVL